MKETIMFTLRIVTRACVIIAAMAIMPAAHAQFAVVDVQAIVQLLQQIEVMREQLSTAQEQLTQAQEEYAAMTGGRQMEQLLRGVERNYLPQNWEELAASLRNVQSAYGALSGDMQGALDANAVLTSAQLRRFSAAELADLEATRRITAMAQALARRALRTTSERFRSLQDLIDAISRAGDQKAILDLQARIGAEATMLANEQTKLQILERAAQAEASAQQQRLLERAIADVGSLRTLGPLGL
jgi:Skp family chaperone for outer membrane proteins